MDVREKLVELLKEISYDQKLGWYDLWDMREGAEDVADLLFTHGVTVQEWIPVTERLPEEPLQTVIVTNGKETCVAVYSVVYDEFGVMCGKGKTFGVTHWMPLPDAPKGE